MAPDPEPPAEAEPPAESPAESAPLNAEPLAPQAEVTVAEALPHALTELQAWAQVRLARATELAHAQEVEQRASRRDRLDPADDLTRALREEDGADFLRRFVDGVIRPEDLLASGFGMSDIADQVPQALTARTRRALRLGAFAGPGAPFIAVPMLRRVASSLFAGELTSRSELSAALGRADDRGATTRIRPLSEPLLGNRGTSAQLDRILDLIANPAVAELELTLADLDRLGNDWDFEGTADRAAGRLAGILLEATHTTEPAFVQLRATSSRDLELAIETFMRALDAEGLERTVAGIAIPADLPESVTLLRRLAGWAHLRREDGGAAIRVAIVRLADHAPELADAKLRGLEPGCYVNPADVDANAVRLIDAVLATEHRGTLELEVESIMPMDAALAVHLAGLRGAFAPVSVVVHDGDGSELPERLAALGAVVRMRIPLLSSAGLRSAVGYLQERIGSALQSMRVDDVPAVGAASLAERRLSVAAERASELPVGPARVQHRVNPEDAPGVTASIPYELFPAGLFEDEPEAPRRDWSESFVAAAPITVLEDADEATTILGRKRVDGSIELAPAPTAAEVASDAEPGDEVAVAPGATDARNLTEIVLGLRQGRRLRNTFRNDPVSDPTQRSVREWADRIRRRAVHSELGVAEAASHLVSSVEEIRDTLDRAHEAGLEWSKTSGWERAALLERLARAVEANRARLIEVAMNETSLTFAEADADLSHAIDLANHDAHLARELDRMQGARFEPVHLSVAVPGWIPPVSSTAATIFAALAAGSAVVLKPSLRTQRSAAILARVCWAAGVSRELLQVASCDDRLITEEQFGRELITDHRVERVLMQGAYETAARFLEWRPDLPLIGSSGGKSSVIVTPAADYDLAAREIARSVVSSSGQHPTRPSVAILVGSAARSQRLTAQLVDAIESVRIGYPADPAVVVGPLVGRATAKQVEALTELATGERWLLEPRSLDDADRLWTPGIRVGVAPESPSARHDAQVPVLNIMTARTLAEAIEIQNRLDYGLASGLFSLDRAEIAEWVQGVEAGNLYVNRDLLGVDVQRHPSGGWKRSMIGTKLKSGGPNTLIHLGKWRAHTGEQSHTLHLRGLEEATQRLIEAMQANLPFDDFERVRRTALSCQIAWNEEFGEVVDRAALGFERNLFRYRPARCYIRAASDADAADLGQVLVAATAARAPILLSTAAPLPSLLERELALREASVTVESDAEFLERMRLEGLAEAPRLRLIGGSRSEVCSALRNGVDIAVFSDDVTLAGRVEMLPFLREQAISITGHRYGHLDERVAELFPHERLGE